MESKSNEKVEKQCKICIESVSRKTGLQCQGVCKSWFHYSCLGYSPGKIKNIKAGILKVICPCPECESISVKEFFANTPHTCASLNCVANQPPICDDKACPIKVSQKILRELLPQHQQNSKNIKQTQSNASSQISRDNSFLCECKSKYSCKPVLPSNSSTMTPRRVCINQNDCRCKKQENDTQIATRNSSGYVKSKYTSSCCVPGQKKTVEHPNRDVNAGSSSNGAKRAGGECTDGAKPERAKANSVNDGLMQFMKQICDTVGQLTVQLNEMMNSIKQVGQKLISSDSDGSTDSTLEICLSATSKKQRKENTQDKPCNCSK